MARLKKGNIVKTILGEDIKILEELGEGGQGIVYKVDYQGKKCALKWYKRVESDAFYKNLKRNAEKGAPAPTFIWPLAVTQKDSKGCFGYVMALRPKEYKDFSLFILNRVKFSGFSAVVNAALIITASFKLLHNKGLSYQDLNDGNFFINPADGDVLICDNDNVAPDGDNLGIQGKPRYMAPEVVLLNHKPDTYSDRFSLAVILFLLLFRNHPLAGKRDNDGDEPDKNERNLYCLNPVFIFDPNDDSNRPKPQIHVNAPRFWPVFPSYIQKMFIQAFDKSLMKSDGSNREDRIMEKEWLKVFVKLRETLIVCSHCHEETFYNLKQSSFKCMNCGKEIKKPVVLDIEGREIPLYPSSKIYRYEIDSLADFTIENIKNEIGTVVENKKNPGVWGIRNLSEITWYRHSPGGKEEIRKKDEVVPVIRSNSIKFGTFCEGTIK
ncbi:MAG: hypothetical protein IJ530_01995 [Treponema sp.]|uniref:protein kinase domain-containing protein n=1 Tax=Treponema sp. TaxID=166 RepID=UPI0025EF0954|nr:hypothetical protein [Treponema sp.]MBQ8678513.1 hypothetical protein [Treponema sp.]